MLLKQTKIVATISDKRCDVDFIKGLFEAGTYEHGTSRPRRFGDADK